MHTHLEKCIKRKAGVKCSTALQKIETTTSIATLRKLLKDPVVFAELELSDPITGEYLCTTIVIRKLRTYNNKSQQFVIDLFQYPNNCFNSSKMFNFGVIASVDGQDDYRKINYLSRPMFDYFLKVDDSTYDHGDRSDFDFYDNAIFSVISCVAVGMPT